MHRVGALESEVFGPKLLADTAAEGPTLGVHHTETRRNNVTEHQAVDWRALCPQRHRWCSFEGRLSRRGAVDR